MTERIVIVGGVALGPKVGCRVKRLMPDAQVTLIDRDSYVSYGGCGIPYYVSGDVADIEGLFSTSAHVVRDVKFFKNAKGVDVITQTEALQIDRESRLLKVKNLVNGEERDIPYDKLVLGTGAQPFIPPIPGMDLPNVTVVANLHHADHVRSLLNAGRVGSAVVIGAGAIGLEMAEALADLWGVETTLVEMQPQLLPVAIGRDFSLILEKHMTDKDVRVLVSECVQSICKTDDDQLLVKTDKNELECDLVIVAVGVRPNSEIARQAGLEIGPRGGIIVNEAMQTSDPNIFAGGDCVEVNDRISGSPVHMPLGSLANRQGRVIANNIAGITSRFRGTVGSFCVKVFELGIARAGLTVEQARKAGFNPVYTVVAQDDRAHFYPTHAMMLMKLIADRNTRQVLGVEALGPNMDAVKSRVDAVAVRLGEKPNLEEISNLEVAYSPPFASAMDIVNSAANALDNTIAGRHDPVDVMEFMDAFNNGAKVIDVRSRKQAEPFIEKYGAQWINIPQEELRLRIGELAGKADDEKTFYLLCGAGTRAYEAQLVLREQGIGNTKNIQGGMKMLISQDTGFTDDAEEEE